MIEIQRLFGILAVALYLYSFYPYFMGMFRRKVRPHLFTWLVWAIVSTIAYGVQYMEGAGAGAWLTGVNALICFVVAVCAFCLGRQQGKFDITRVDWLFLGMALAAIPVWLLMDQPLMVVIWVSLIDGLAFGPTFRKTWVKPREESVATFLWSGISAFLSILAMESSTVITVTYPTFMLISNMMLVSVILGRRRFVKE